MKTIEQWVQLIKDGNTVIMPLKEVQWLIDYIYQFEKGMTIIVKIDGEKIKIGKG